MAYLPPVEIKIAHTKCGSSDRTNFPVLLLGDYPFLATIANGGDIHNTVSFNGQTVPADFAISADAGNTVPYSFDFASYVTSSGHAVVEIYVKVPTVSHTVDTVFYIHYGDASVTTYQGGAVGAAYDSNYKEILHFADGTTLSLVDSTASGNITTISLLGVPGNSVAASGPIDGAYGTNNSHLETAYNSSLDCTSGFSAQMWFKPSILGSTDNTIFFKGNDGTSTYDYCAFTRGASATQFLVIIGGVFLVMNCSLSTSAFNKLDITADGSNVRIYLNGSQVSFTGTAALPTGSLNPLEIAAKPDGSQYSPTSVFDEFRISSVARDADWILTEYNNQSSPSTFYSVGGLVSQISNVVRETIGSIGEDVPTAQISNVVRETIGSIEEGVPAASFMVVNINT